MSEADIDAARDIIAEGRASHAGWAEHLKRCPGCEQCKTLGIDWGWEREQSWVERYDFLLGVIDSFAALRQRHAEASVCELAAGNPNVASYAAHWEGRAERAGAELASEGVHHEAPEESSTGRSTDAEPSPAASSPETAAQASGRRAGTTPSYRVGTDGREVSPMTCDTCQMQSASLDPLCVRVEKPCSVLGGGCFAWVAREGGVGGRVDVARLVEQAHAVSTLLSEAEVGPCSLPEGVRLLMNDRDRLADEIAALRQRHAEAVEAAFKEGRSSDQRAQDDAAWLASEAKTRLT